MRAWALSVKEVVSELLNQFPMDRKSGTVESDARRRPNMKPKR